MVAGKTTNVAFGMMRRAAEAFVAKYPKYEDYFSVLEFFKLRMVSEKRHVIVCRDTCRIEGAGGEATSGLQPVALDPHTASLLCLSGATIVRDLMRKVRDPSYEPQANGHGFAELLYEGSPEIRRFCKDPRFLEQQAGSMAGDRFLHGILSVASNDDNASTPLWLAVAAQCYKSVYDALDGNMNAGARQYVAVLKDSVDTLHSYRDFEYFDPINICDVENNMRGYAEGYRLAGTAISTLMNAKRHDILRESAKSTIPLYATLNQPTVCCEIAYSILTATHYNFCGLADEHLLIQAMAHLYVACRTVNLIDESARWHDMESFLEGRDHLLATTNVSADLYTMATHYQLAIGCRPDLAQMRRDPRLECLTIRQGYRPIGSRSKLFVKRKDFEENAARSGRSFGDVAIIGMLLETAAEAQRQRDKTSKRSREDLTPIQLLSAFKASLILDEPELNFDVIRLHQQCNSLLAAAIKEAEAVSQLEDLMDYGGASFTNMVLLKTAVHVNRRVSGPPVLLAVVAETIQRFIRGQSDKFLKEALGKSSGHGSDAKMPSVTRKALKRMALFDTFMREVMAKARGWTFEGESADAIIYANDVFEETSGRLSFLAEQLDNLDECSKRSDNFGADADLIAKDLANAFGAWAGTGFESEPPFALVRLLASLRHKIDQASHGTEEHANIPRRDSVDKNDEELAENWLMETIMGES